MIKIIYSTILTVLIFQMDLYAQVTVYSEYDKDGNVSIFSDNSHVIPYSILLDITTAENLDSNGNTMVAYPGKTTLLKLKRRDPMKSTRINFSYKTVKGKYIQRGKRDIPYLLPVPEGQEVMVMKIYSLQDFDLPVEDRHQMGASIRFEQPTLICAPRKGIVSEIKEGDEVIRLPSISYPNTKNHCCNS